MIYSLILDKYEQREGGRMKDKIKYFSKGDFQIKKPGIIFSDTNLFLKIGEGEIYHGSFLIENQLDGDIRGLVY